MNKFKIFVAIFSLLLASFVEAKILTLEVSNPNPEYGVFSTYYLKVETLNDKRNRVRLLEPLVFIDRHGKKWTAPKGYIVDGATIPKVFQPLVGTPYGGEYVLASVIHDVACDEKKEPWREVHRVFYEAMLASGVDEDKASTMYLAVYEAAPRWGENQREHLSHKEILHFLKGVDSLAKQDLKKLGGVVQNILENILMEIEKQQQASK